MKRFIIVAITLLIFVTIVGCTSQQDNTQLIYIDVSPVEAKELIDENPDIVIVDVSPHYDNGHLPGAVHYYLRR